MSAGSTIKEIRKRRGWTQRQLGIKAGVHAQMIVAYEKERVIPKVDSFEKILNAMGYELYARPRKEKK